MQFFGNPRKKCWKTCAERIIADESVDEKKGEMQKKKEKVFQKSQHPVDHKTVFGVVDM